ncbi:hypothetical protein A4X09_0g738 [Tilletia walkeri]|uniref:Uncharacterized protein n=1 Tax=Tilletia walkeri TaxID=117179 RepID=A0A8X7T7R7_9BASI|nr:hypothetical protein A4X09_0g738 [Tilletia walkeri]
MPSQEEDQQILIFLPPKRLRSLKSFEDGDEEDGEDEDKIESRRLKYRRLDLDDTQGSAASAGRPVGSGSLDQGDDVTREEGERSYTREEGREDDRGVTQEGTSLAPPPSFHFALNRVTPVSEILAHPDRFIKVDDAAPHSRSKVNLLVLVREVGSLERYEPKYRQQGGASSRWLPPAQGYRSHLVVCDRDGSLLKLTLWDRCARAWAGEEEDEDEDRHARSHASRSKAYDTTTQLDQSRISAASGSEKSNMMGGRGGQGLDEDSVTAAADHSTASSLGNAPRTLRAGDVVYLTKLQLSRPRGSTAAVAANSSRTARHRIPNAASAIQVSTSSESDVQLCFRSEIRSRRDEGYAYIGPDRIVGSELSYLAEFDAHCRAVWQLVRRWL